MTPDCCQTTADLLHSNVLYPHYTETLTMHHGLTGLHLLVGPFLVHTSRLSSRQLTKHVYGPTTCGIKMQLKPKQLY